MDVLFDRLRVEGPRLAAQDGERVDGVLALLDTGDELSAIALVPEHTRMGMAGAKGTLEQTEGVS